MPFMQDGDPKHRLRSNADVNQGYKIGSRQGFYLYLYQYLYIYVFCLYLYLYLYLHLLSISSIRRLILRDPARLTFVPRHPSDVAAAASAAA